MRVIRGLFRRWSVTFMLLKEPRSPVAEKNGAKAKRKAGGYELEIAQDPGVGVESG
jgi:hypothetical protein